MTKSDNKMEKGSSSLLSPEGALSQYGLFPEGLSLNALDSRREMQKSINIADEFDHRRRDPITLEKLDKLKVFIAKSIINMDCD